MGISIHALLKRATKFSELLLLLNFISIHALLKRATGVDREIKFYRPHFNSRSPEESDLNKIIVRGQESDFNSRSPEESDLMKEQFAISTDNFNSRSPEESDLGKHDNRYRHILISIHALLKRATYGRINILCQYSNFNSRSPEESDCLLNEER